MNNTKKSSKLRLSVLLTLLAVTAVAYLNLRAILDWVALYNYAAPTAVAQLATEDTMSADARRIFYVNKPALQGKTQFKDCQTAAEKTIVLGCYHGNQQGIYILTVDDARLDGVEQVTAAHEMLHAAYERLSGKERADIDRQLRQYFNNDLKDERVRATIENYRSFEPNELTNEMHSILGTEVGNLPAPLEKYYSRYFGDRSKVVGFAAQYQAEFTSRQDKIKAYDTQLETLKAQIDSQQKSLEEREKDLDSSSRQLQALRSSGDTQGYNAGVPGFNAKVNAYNVEVRQVKAAIEQYNQLVSDRNAIVLEAQELSNEIDSSVAPIDQK